LARWVHRRAIRKKIALIITRKKMAIFLNILIDALQWKRLMP
jgi:hypothetical protein